MQFSDRLLTLAAEAESALAPMYAEVDRIAFANTARVMDAFAEFRVSEACFAATTGYGYDDLGRETLDKIYARVFGAESAFVRHNIVNGTQALTIGLFGLLRPGDIMLSVTGKPYDTLEEVIGIVGARQRFAEGFRRRVSANRSAGGRHRRLRLYRQSVEP